MHSKAIQNKIQIKSGENIVMLNPATIIYFAARDSLSLIYQSDWNIIEIPLSLNELEKKLNTFFRIHSDYLINLEYLDNVSETGNGYVIVGKWHKLPIDSNKIKILMEGLSGFTR